MKAKVLLTLATAALLMNGAFSPIDSPYLSLFSDAAAQAGVREEIIITPPPPPRKEIIITAPSPRHVWIPGHWVWHGGWIWEPGRWVVRPRPEVAWVPGHWISRGNGWVWIPGHWR